MFLGFINRQPLIVLFISFFLFDNSFISIVLIEQFSSSFGVPFLGIKTFIGTSSGSSVDREKASSIRCFGVSPIPIMPPQQSSRPASLTVLAVLTLSAKSWVLHISEKKLSEASKLWL